MKFEFFVARRYLFSRKKTHAINIISLVAVVGVAVATMALVIVLSVFNGFHDLVASFFTNFDPQLKVVPIQGKTAPADDPLLTQLRHFPEVQVATETLEDQALAVYAGQQAMVVIKGVDDNFDSLTHISDILYGEGHFDLHVADLQFGIPGIRLAQNLGLGTRWRDYLYIYAPERQGQLDLSAPQSGFVTDSLFSPGVVFSVRQSKYDGAYLLTSITFARNLFGQQGRLSALEFRFKPGTDLADVQRRMAAVAGSRYRVLNRFEQQQDTFRIMQVEKLMAYLFLSFILVVACFNIVGALSMLILDKRADAATLRHLGATPQQARRIFLYEGRFIGFIGAVAGVALGLLLCWLQQTFGFVKMGDAAGTFVVDAYPVSVHYWDVFFVFLTVVVVSWVAVWWPVRVLSRRLL